uniref:KIB1-4 beta-propeller domain-containing protein n=1 Tax=Oryza barthii TaxID=65489 RepID=A0A0D3EYI6_9ORYZ
MAPPVCFSDLPPEALDDIARRAGALNNVVCSAVCRPWRRDLKTTRLGLLKQPNRPYSVNLELWCGSIELHPIRRCINGEQPSASPTTTAPRQLYPLPPITSSGSKKVAKDLDQMGESMFQKAELVPGHRLGTFAVMLIHGGGFGMSFLRPGAKCWTAVRVPKWMKQKFVDVVFHQGAFYTVSRDAEVSAWTPDASRSRGRSARGSPSWCRSAAATCSWCLGCTSARGRGSPWRTSGRRPSWWGAAAA